MMIRGFKPGVVPVQSTPLQTPSTPASPGGANPGPQGAPPSRFTDSFTPSVPAPKVVVQPADVQPPSGLTRPRKPQNAETPGGLEQAPRSTDTTPVFFDPNITATPDVEALISRLSDVRAQHGLEPISEAQLADIRKLSGNDLLMYEFSVGKLEQLAAGTITSADYMFSVLDEAARIAGDDTRLFRHLVTFAFASEPSGPFSGQNLAGRHGHVAGSSLEETHYDLCGKLMNADQGFNPAVLDTLYTKTSNVSHHFSAFVEIAQGLGGPWGIELAHGSLGDAGTNPGDVRNGNFGGMVGFAVRWNEMSPTDLVSLIRWAYSATPDAPAPWGTPATNADGASVPFGDDGSHFKLETWVALYNEAHPGAPITER